MRLFLALSLCLAMASCGSDDGPSNPGTPTAVSGTVIKGLVANSAVTVLSVANDGSPGSVVAGPFTTDDQGVWSGEIPAGARGPFFLRADGGTYVDEASGESVDLGSGSLMSFSSGGSGTVSPFTQMLCDVVEASGAASDRAEAWQTAIGSFVAAFGFDPTTTVPTSTGTEAQKRYVAALGGVSQFIDDSTTLGALTGVSLFEITMAIIADVADNALDGNDIDGNPISIGNSGNDLPALELTGLAALVSAINDFADANPDLAALIFGPILLDFGDLFDPGNGGENDTLTLSGPGTSALPQSIFVANYGNSSGNVYSWSGFTTGTGAMAISLIETVISDEPFVTIAFAFSDLGVSLGWQRSATGSIPGLSHVGDRFVFEDVVLVSDSDEGDLTFNGTLDIRSAGN